MTMPRSDVVIFRGAVLPLPGVDVRNVYHPQGFRLPDAHLHGRFSDAGPRGIVLHDTVTGTASSGFRALVERAKPDGTNMRLGSAFLLGPDGVLCQIVPDLADVTWHASGWSAWGVGLDVVSWVDPKLAPRSPLRRPRTAWAPGGYLDYAEEQKRVLRAAVPLLCGILGVPFDCPREKDGKPALRGYGRGPVKGLAPGAFRGVAGHAQVSKVRWDGNVALDVLFGAGPVIA